MISFHPGAAEAFERAAANLIQSVKDFGVETKRRPTPNFEIHPVANLTEADIIGSIEMTGRAVDGAGRETGRFWTSQGRRYGWDGEQYMQLRKLAERIANDKSLCGLVSESFVLELIVGWLRAKLEGDSVQGLSAFISARSESAIVEREYVVPLYRTYSSAPVQFGDIIVKPVTKEFLDRWFSKQPGAVPTEYENLRAEHENKTRSRFQGSLAVHVCVKGEPIMGSEIALQSAITASALLRMLSTANLVGGVRSYTQPYGMDGTTTWHHFEVDGKEIESLNHRELSLGPNSWLIDEAREGLPGLLVGLSDLYSNRNTEYRSALFDAILTYTRNSLVADPADKLVFVLVALESMLLRGNGEPIQTNLSERMAFLIGGDLAERKRIVANVKKLYSMRSKFIHHGQGIDDVAVLDDFLMQAWLCMIELINRRVAISTREQLLATLDEMKLS